MTLRSIPAQQQRGWLKEHEGVVTAHSTRNPRSRYSAGGAHLPAPERLTMPAREPIDEVHASLGIEQYSASRTGRFMLGALAPGGAWPQGLDLETTG